MSNETNLSTIIDAIEPEKAMYDKNVKELLSDIQVLARIVKYTVKEVEHLSIEEIMKCIVPESVKTGEVDVNPGLTNLGKVESLQTENSVPGEGYITFDIRFILHYDEEELEIIINIEAQKSTDHNALGYYLENRIVFYLARLISSQKETQFHHSEYDDIKKVYSIWICMDAEKDEEGIAEISLNTENVYGKEMSFPKLDKMCGIVIRIRKEDGEKSKNKLIAMLEDLLSTKNKAVKKLIMVEEYGMVMTAELERSVDMCNLSDVIVEVAMKNGLEKGIAEGLEKGIEKGIAEGIKKGIPEGEALFGRLCVKLIEADRSSDVILAAQDEDAKRKFYIEFGLLQEET